MTTARATRRAHCCFSQACVLSICCAHNCVRPLPSSRPLSSQQPPGMKVDTESEQIIILLTCFWSSGRHHTQWEDFRSIQCCGLETRSWGQVCFENLRSQSSASRNVSSPVLQGSHKSYFYGIGYLSKWPIVGVLHRIHWISVMRW